MHNQNQLGTNSQSKSGTPGFNKRTLFIRWAAPRSRKRPNSPNTNTSSRSLNRCSLRWKPRQKLRSPKAAPPLDDRLKPTCPASSELSGPQSHSGASCRRTVRGGNDIQITKPETLNLALDVVPFNLLAAEDDRFPGFKLQPQLIVYQELGLDSLHASRTKMPEPLSRHDSFDPPYIYCELKPRLFGASLGLGLGRQRIR